MKLVCSAGCSMAVYMSDRALEFWGKSRAKKELDAAWSSHDMYSCRQLQQRFWSLRVDETCDKWRLRMTWDNILKASIMIVILRKEMTNDWDIWHIAVLKKDSSATAESILVPHKKCSCWYHFKSTQYTLWYDWY